MDAVKSTKGGAWFDGLELYLASAHWRVDFSSHLHCRYPPLTANAISLA
jgi:hypothetical protein